MNYKELQTEIRKAAETAAQQHRSAYEDWQEGAIRKVWFDESYNLCIEYESGKWYHYTESGEWF